MKKLTMFYLQFNDQCKMAERLIFQVTHDYPQFERVKIERIEEDYRRDIASKYDYFYVPTFYIDNEKIHEGDVEYDDVVRILQTAYER